MKRLVLPLALSWTAGLAIALYAFNQSQQTDGLTKGEQMVILRGPNGQEVGLAVEIADEPHERSRGLMHRERLKEGTGMLFLFDEPQAHSFWMKNTLIPLDILFFDQNGQFVSRNRMQPCPEDPCPLFVSEKPSMAALEVNAGEEAVQKVDDGWKIVY